MTELSHLMHIDITHNIVLYRPPHFFVILRIDFFDIYGIIGTTHFVLYPENYFANKTNIRYSWVKW